MKPLDTDQLLATGALSGPYRRTHSFTLSLWARLSRAVRRFFLDHRSL